MKTAIVKRYRAQYAQLEAGARPEELAQARDRVRKAKAALDLAKRTFDRTQELVERAFVPPQELDNAQSAYQTALAEYNIAQDDLTLVQNGAREEDRQAARAQLQEAEATLRLAQVQLGYTTLTAPIAGVIAERFVDRGTFVTLSTPVVAIVAMDRVKVLGRLPVYIGIIMLAGVVVNHGIILVDYTNQLRDDGSSVREALLQAGRTRLRPILITTLTTVLALLPMSFGYGEGAEMWSPLGRVVAGGLSVSTLFTLFFIPALYSLVEDCRRRLQHLRSKKSMLEENGHTAV